LGGGGLNENLEIPISWLQLTLGEVVDYGKTDKIEPNAIPAEAWVLELEDIEKDTSKLLQRLSFTQRQSKSTKNKFILGDVLYGKLRPYLNKVLIADCDGYCSTEILPLKSNQAIDGRFLFYWLKHPEFLDYVESVSHGINMPRLGTEAGLQAPLVLAPLNEQKRIADKLDALLARVDACRERLDRVPLILKRFRQAVLAAATSGQLTEDWHRGAEIKQWEMTSLIKICRSITDGDHQAPPKVGTGIPFITISAISDGRLRVDSATRFVPQTYFDALKIDKKPEPGDVLFSVTGSVAIPVLVDVDVPFIFQRHIAILKPNVSRIESKFLLYSLGTEDIKQQAMAVATGTAQLTIPLTGLRAFQIMLPTLEEQYEIVRRVETLFAYADRLETRYKNARAQVEQLTPMLLAKAFRGELVTQDPNDEPASVLIERIRSVREAQPAQTKRISTGKKTTMTKMTKESIKEAIHQLPKDKFSFDELRETFPGDYDSLKEIVFALLSEGEPSLTQVFDQEVQAMRFVRGNR
jgi:type I restriction enzyme, S subunit